MLNFWKIQFPIYPLKAEPQLIDNILFTENNKGDYLVIDNKNMPGATLGIRRIQHIKASSSDIVYRKLFVLKYPIHNFISILHKGVFRFIDSSGKVYNYIKTKFVPLETYKLKSYQVFPEGYVIHVHNLHCSFFSNRAPNLQEKYVQVLRMGRGFLMYGFSTEFKKTTRMKI